jgi:hypothetical protein
MGDSDGGNSSYHICQEFPLEESDDPGSLQGLCDW